ncbi:MAG: hypothetical protein GC136_11295 [Alphaproteobacteria bacterium]|nr:hypothetical protein [Alphaproteobacteria bacterium]
MSKFSDWAMSFERGRAWGSTPRVVVFVLIAFFVLLDALVLWMDFPATAAIMCGYTSAILLLLELLEETGTKILIEWTKTFKDKTDAPSCDEEIQAKVVSLITEVRMEKAMKYQPFQEGEQNPSAGKEAKIDSMQVWPLLYLWLVYPVIHWIKKATGLVTHRAWLEPKERTMDTFKLRFLSFVFLVLAINFEICARVF